VRAEAHPEGLSDPYIDLVKRALTHTLYGDIDLGGYGGWTVFSRIVGRLLRMKDLVPMRIVPVPEEAREEGLDWPIFAQTMIGRKRLDNLHFCVDDVLVRDVPGDLIETGVWRGGATILMRAILKARGVEDRTVWVADSFAGLPAADSDRYPSDGSISYERIEALKVSLEEVEENFRRYGLLDDQVRFLKGWFRDTLPSVADRQWAVIRLDGDMYESTMDALTNLYPGLSPGGYAIIDDYHLASCRDAVTDYRAEHGIDEEIHPIDSAGVYWEKRAR
jgi:O-methyltransferase